MNSSVFQLNKKTLSKMFKLINEIDGTYIPFIILMAVIKSLQLFMNIYFPLIVIDNLLYNDNNSKLIYLIIVFLVINAILNVAINFFDSKLKVKSKDISLTINLKLGQRTMSMDYENIEDPEILDLKEKALFPIKNQNIIPRMIVEIGNCVTSIFSLIAIILMISGIHFGLVLVVITVVLINTMISKKSKKVEMETMNTVIPLNREFSYYMKVITDFTYAKDIRLYSIENIIIDKLKKYQSKSLQAFRKLLLKQGSYKGILGVNLQIQIFVVSFILIYLAYAKKISIGELVIMLNATKNLSSTLQGMIASFLNIKIFNRYLEPYFEFYYLNSEKIFQKGIEINEIKTIEFRNVTFYYPRSKEKTLDNVSLTLEKGKSYSLVGLNGAGKTTLIKILCKLYKPTSGSILINGVDLQFIDYTSYMKQLSCVFQDFKLFSFSIKDNIILNSSYNYRKVKEVIANVGLSDKIQRLKKGLETNIYRIFDKDGIEFSGGEEQKLAIARALYRDSSVMIFDEPTSSLDPIMEYEIYKKLNSTLENNKDKKITIFISHRLSSCKLCDYIYVLDKGKIIQEGTFKELILDKNNMFYKMWEKQAQYYV